MRSPARPGSGPPSRGRRGPEAHSRGGPGRPGPGRGPCHEHLAGTAAGHREHRALRDTTGAAILDDDQARVLLAALAAGQKWQGGNYADLRAQPGWAAAEAALKETGLIYSRGGPDEVHVSDDVRFSLRYRVLGLSLRELAVSSVPAGQRPAGRARERRNGFRV